MKHIKTFETATTNMIPGMMYKTNVGGMITYILGFIGVNRNRDFFLTCMEFNENKPTIIEFKNVDVIPLNISIKDYIIKRDEMSKIDLVDRTLDILKNPDYGTKTSKKLANNLYRELSEDDDIQLYIQSKKYNL